MQRRVLMFFLHSSHERRPPTVVCLVRSSFEQLIDRRGAALLGTLTLLVGRNDAEDLWQETFLAALRAFDRVPPLEEERAWLWTIAHRKAIDHWRYIGRHPTSALPEESTIDSIEALVSTDPTIAIVDTLAIAHSLWPAVRALPTKQRWCVAYRFVADLSFAEIGALVGCSSEAARRSSHEGIVRLRKEATK